MPQVTGTLFEGKPLIQVTVADALPAPPAVSPQTDITPFSIRPYKALLDTGADITCLCDNVIEECRLRPYGFIRMVGSVGPSLHDTHIIRLGILCGDEALGGEPRSLYQLEAQEAAAIRANRWFDIIIGTDIISQHELRLTKGGGFAFILS
jgi:hypothetical protein